MRLTFLSKVMIVLIVLGAVGAGVYANRDSALLAPLLGKMGKTNTGGGEVAKPDGTKPEVAKPEPAQPAARPEAPKPTPESPAANPSGRPRIVLGVNDFGGAYPALVANDGAMPGPNSLFTKAGLDVEVRLVRGSKERLEQFDAGQIDVMLLTLDYVANLYADYKAKGEDVQTFLFVDWSRGNLGIVTKPGFTSIESLKSARVATTRNTPTHYFLLTLLDRSSLKPGDIDVVKQSLVFAKKTPQAGEMFQRGEVDAVAIWEPHLSQSIEKGNGRLLVSTLTATNLIADVLFARSKFLDQNAAHMPAFLKAWFEGVRRLKSDPDGSVAIIAKAFEQTPEDTRSILGKIKPATFADNRAFFGLDTESSPYARLIEEAGQIWVREGVIQQVPAAKAVARTKFLEAVAKDYSEERVVEEFKFTAPKAGAEALLTKSASIYFDSGSAELDGNARRAIDGFADQLVGVFQNAYVRVEGNTDNVGNRKTNITLSEKRAAAVVEYLVGRHRFDPARFVAVGNGPDRPVADNGTAEGREWNRRTDFRIVPNY